MITMDVDMVVMDIQLPGLDGVEATRQLKSQHPGLKVVIVSAYGEEYLIPSIDAGADGYMMKGQEPSEMQSRLAEAMGMILKIWTSDGPYELVGEHWTVKLESNGDEMGFGVVQKPYQRPHPPISVPVTSRGSGSVAVWGLTYRRQ